MTAIIKAENLGIRFKLNRRKASGIKANLERVVSFGSSSKTDFWALRGINFTINKGDILGVIGKNGSGKSTLLRTLGGIYQPDEGEMDVNGSVSALLSLGTGFKQDLNGIENIYLNGSIMGFNKKEIKAKIDEIVDFAELGKFIYEPVKNYSSGMKARLGFSIAIALKRDIMLIDEILGVGDFKFRNKSQEKMKEIIGLGQTVVIVSHNLDSIKKYATKAIWINQGELMAEGSVQEVLEKYENS